MTKRQYWNARLNLVWSFSTGNNLEGFAMLEMLEVYMKYARTKGCYPDTQTQAKMLEFKDIINKKMECMK